MTLDLWYDYYFFLWSNKSAVLLFFLVIRVGRSSTTTPRSAEWTRFLSRIRRAVLDK